MEIEGLKMNFTLINGIIKTNRQGIISTPPALTNQPLVEVNMAKNSLPNFFSNDNLVPHSTRSQFVDLTGQRFERLVVLGYKGRFNKHSFWLCVCDCGSLTCVRSNSLRTSKTQSRGWSMEKALTTPVKNRRESTLSRRDMKRQNSLKG